MSDEEKQNQERFGGRTRNRYSWPPQDGSATDKPETKNENDKQSEDEQ